MYKLFILLFLSLFINISNAQIKAVTEAGDEVLLFDDNTWKYAEGQEIEEVEIPLNEKKFEKDKKATFCLKSKKVPYGYCLDAKEWVVKKNQKNGETEFELGHKKLELYSMIINESVEIPLTGLKEIVVQNGRAAAPDLKLVHEEYRMVNGIKVLHLQMNGTLYGINFTYFGYYYTSEKGTTQFVVYGSTKIVEENKEACETLLNGFVENASKN